MYLLYVFIISMTKLEKYIEDVGLFYEQFGLPKMAGRILGYLMATTDDKISFDKLMQKLKASKGSISGNINLLLGQKLIEKYTISGDRKSYYRFSSRSMHKMLEDKLNSVQNIIKIFAGANEINTNPESIKHQQINEIVDFYQFLEEEIPKLRVKWHNLKSDNNES